MKTHAKNESAAHGERQIGVPVRAAELHDASSSAIVDKRASTLTMQHLQDMANSSPRTMQLKQQAQLMLTSPRSKRQQHFQQMADNSTRPTQLQRQADVIAGQPPAPAQREKKPNNTGLPDRLKSGIEALSGMSIDHVRVHYDSDKPAQLRAHAYTQGSEIHVAPGQERHLPHEAWHVVQQAQGRVRPTLQMKLGAVNDDPSLEKEADAMGEKAAQFKGDHDTRHLSAGGLVEGEVTQRKVARVGFEFQMLNSKVTLSSESDGSSGDNSDDNDCFVFESDEQEEVNRQDRLRKVTWTAEAHQYGSLWRVENDGDNLEFVTNPFDSIEQLKVCMAELTRIANHISKTTELPAFFQIGDKVVELIASDSKAQPQVNADIALDDLPDFVEYVAGDQGMQNELFSAEGVFGWNRQKTMEEVERGKEAAKKIATINNDVIVKMFGVTGDDVDVYEKLATIRGMLLVMVQAAIHGSEYSTKLTKDMPILLKTSMAKTWRALKGSIVKQQPKVKDLVGLFSEDDVELEKLEAVVKNVFKGIDPVWGSDNTPNDIPRQLHQAGVKSNRKQVFIELRRVPVLPIEKWSEFAHAAFNQFHGEIFPQKERVQE